ncbi:MAG TPA: DMT family transporter [Oceanobacillus sp.]|nr:DMT family transporter [Oceanobacillus sp.]
MAYSRIGILYIFAAVLGYSFLPVFINHLLDAGVEPLDIALWRYLIVTPVFWVLSFARPAGNVHLPRFRIALILGPLLAVAAVVAFFGLDLIPPGTYVVIFYTYPAMVAIISLFMGERLSSWGWIALALTLVGVGLSAPDFSEGMRGENLPGVLFALSNALVVAVYFVISNRLLRGRANTIPAVVQASAWTVSGTFLSLFAVALFTGFSIPQSSDVWLNLVGLALVSTLLPIFTLNIGIQKLGPTRAAIFGTIEPLTTSLLALIFLGEIMQPIQWLGGLVIVASVILLQTLGSQPERRMEMRASGD